MDQRLARNPRGPAPDDSYGWVEVDPDCRFAIKVASDREAEEEISRSLASGVFPPEYRPLLRELHRLVPVGGRVLDLGAHVGVFSLAASASGYQVVSVEASPRNASLLRASASLNGFDGMTVVEAGVSDRSGILEFCPYGPYGHAVTDRTEQYTSIEVRSTTVDDLLSDLGWDRVDFIKMDIEGSEVAAVRGMARLLSRPDSPPIFYESNRHTLAFFDKTPRDLKASLVEHGYRNLLVTPDGLVPVTPDEEQGETVVDYLAIKG
ncbi:FkbM family methyltransferase [Tautonia plasticadhaerens]|uniref:Methyltransferase domain protein n=1 Tax=Tautonia plasticadhaerens TaxID=2527974 RepID=A0A518GYE9_9BACT|nr:FkbM family methyltransferase [Tautonia plasticadhaerens]QDV33625.1 Methyltransferase domain protein [Tautonia plasticadhaerens]